MERMTDTRIVLISRRTRLQELIVRYNTVEQAQFHIQSLGGDFSEYLQEDAVYTRALKETKEILEAYGRVLPLDRSFVPHYLFAPGDVVVAAGQDGLVANTLKYLDGQPLVGVNPDPSRWDGVLLPFLVDDLRRLMPEVLQGKRPIREVAMAEAALSDGQTLHAVNDLFIGPKTHVSARYALYYDGQLENQSSSGVIVSTGLGSSGWLRSVIAGAAGTVGALTGQLLPDTLPEQPDWGAKSLYFSVREPFPSRTTGASLTFGKVTEAEPLTLVSQMAENGVIFSDGIEEDFLTFNAGVEASIRIADKRGQLVC